MWCYNDKEKETINELKQLKEEIKKIQETLKLTTNDGGKYTMLVVIVVGYFVTLTV